MVAEQVTIYALRDPDSGDIRYVGQTIMPLQKRLSYHLSDYSSAGAEKVAWLRDLKARGKKPEIIILEVTDAAQANAREKAHLGAHLARGCPLVNTNSRLPTFTRRASATAAAILPAEVYNRLVTLARLEGYSMGVAVRTLLVEALAAREAVEVERGAGHDTA